MQKRIRESSERRRPATLVGLRRVDIIGACVVGLAVFAGARYGGAFLARAREVRGPGNHGTRVMPVLASRVEAAPTGQGTPCIRFARTEVNFGAVGPRSIPKVATFAFENTGTGILHVTGIRKCCGTEVKLEGEKLLPGQTGTVTVHYTVSGIGQVQRRLLVSTNDPRHPSTVLTIRGKVEQMLRWEPQRLPLHAGKPNGGCGYVVLESRNGEVFSVKGFTATNDCIKLAFDPNYRATKFVFRPDVDVNKLLALDPPHGEMSFQLSHTECERVSIRFDLIPPFAVDPHEIFIMDAEPGTCVTRQLKVFDNEGNSPGGLVIDSARMTSGTVVLRDVESTGAACTLQLDITPPVPEPGRRYLREELILRIADGKEVKLKVRILYAGGTSPP